MADNNVADHIEVQGTLVEPNISVFIYVYVPINRQEVSMDIKKIGYSSLFDM